MDGSGLRMRGVLRGERISRTGGRGFEKVVGEEVFERLMGEGL